ncbi:hypothetical protein BSL78_16309 [Apostichopus japonicus]|uniref:UBX domain-containing protein n=1 Tax=Stichopus japonicus TaxID=307972 RepID=A0A2G8KFQ9_STIJA|nr:hypothetical protein BSL78_16309 [Apostichopus japonicus]
MTAEGSPNFTSAHSFENFLLSTPCAGHAILNCVAFDAQLDIIPPWDVEAKAGFNVCHPLYLVSKPGGTLPRQESDTSGLADTEAPSLSRPESGTQLKSPTMTHGALPGTKEGSDSANQTANAQVATSSRVSNDLLSEFGRFRQTPTLPARTIRTMRGKNAKTFTVHCVVIAENTTRLNSNKRKSIAEQTEEGTHKKVCFLLSMDCASFFARIREEFPILQDIDFKLFRCGSPTGGRQLEPLPANADHPQAIKDWKGLKRSCLYIRPVSESDAPTTSQSDAPTTSQSDAAATTSYRYVCQDCCGKKVTINCERCIQNREFKRGLDEDKRKDQESAFMLRRQQKRESFIQRLEELRQLRKERVRPEPDNGIALRIYLTNNRTISRKFNVDDDCKALFDFIGSQPESSMDFTLMIPSHRKSLTSAMQGKSLKDLGILVPTVIHVKWEEDNECELSDNEETSKDVVLSTKNPKRAVINAGTPSVSFSFPVEVISDNNHQLIPFGAVEHQHLLNSVLSEDHDDDESELPATSLTDEEDILTAFVDYEEGIPPLSPLEAPRSPEEFVLSDGDVQTPPRSPTPPPDFEGATQRYVIVSSFKVNILAAHFKGYLRKQSFMSVATVKDKHCIDQSQV